MTGYVNLINLSYGNGGYDDNTVYTTERPQPEGPKHAPSPTIQEMTSAANMGILAHSPHSTGADFILDNPALGFEKQCRRVNAVEASEKLG